MADAIAFDTHRFVKHLTASGFSETQAEALADEQVQLLERNLATKVDIHALKVELKADIEKVRAELLKWMVGALTAQTGVLAALFALL